MAAWCGDWLDDHSGRDRTYFTFFLSPFSRWAMLVAVIVVAVELGVISFIPSPLHGTPFLQAAFQVIVAAFWFFLTGWLIGSA